MNDPRGSVWRKWDLHVHTPDSIVQNYGGGAAWDKYIDALSKLPPEFKVLGINDYIFLDGYKKVVAAKAAGKLPNIDLLLPVVELRLDKFGGSDGALSRINFHIIFSDEISPDIIESQFLGALCSKYVLTPEFDSLRTGGKWAAVPTRKSIEDLGTLIIGSAPPEKKTQFSSPIQVGFNNLCVSLSAIQGILESPYFAGKTLTAVGKTEWADIKWNTQSIADKKTIINSADFVFTSAATPADWEKAQKSLLVAQVNSRLLDCSDAHAFPDSKEKDRLGKCYTWIKADPTFEGLRQTLYEPTCRIAISSDKPLEPLLKVGRVLFNFPENTQLVSEFDGEQRTDQFCFRGRSEIIFSPYLTCLIGGRGSGKSTLLNLVHEKLVPGNNEFFKANRVTPQPEASIATCVAVDGDVEKKVVEFLQQNEIERFATDPWRFTEAVFSRLAKRDDEGKLAAVNAELAAAIRGTSEHAKTLQEHANLLTKIADFEKELASKRALIASFQNQEYQGLSAEMGAYSRDLQGLRTWRERVESLTRDLGNLLARQTYPVSDNPNGFEREYLRVTQTIRKLVLPGERNADLMEAENKERELTKRVAELRLKLEDYLRGRGLSAENLADVGKANQRAAQLEQELPALKANLKALAAQILSFQSKRDLPQKYAATVSALLAPINNALKDLSREVKQIELLYEFDVIACRQTLLEHIQDCLGAANVRIDHVESMLQDINLLEVGDRETFVAAIPENHKTGKALRDYYSNSLNFELLRIEAEKQLLEVGGFGRVRVLYDKKPVENTSFGQRCTAAIVVLLMLGNTPIVIDEPEAHLDSALIANYLVELVKIKKVNRQIIFATHNANFVVNGDAELIHVLEMTEDKRSKVVSTTIEDLTHRSELMRLEGGEEAFAKREYRYRARRMR